MKKQLLVIALLFSVGSIAQDMYSFPTTDTMRAAVYYSKYSFSNAVFAKNTAVTTIGFAQGALSVFTHKKASKRFVSFAISGVGDDMLSIVANGESVKTKKVKKKMLTSVWYYPLKEQTTYQYMVNALPDSAEKTTIFTAYIFLPETNSWKLISAIKRKEEGSFLKGLTASNVMPADSVHFWVQTDRGRWTEIVQGRGYTKKLTNERPQIDWSKNHDSAAQAKKDLRLIYDAVSTKKIDTTGSKEGVYYQLTKEGTGKQVKLTDTVTVFYKGSLLSDGSIFDQTKDKPATFPLNRLIKGWQVAVPMCRVGGSVRVVIPSALAYSIRSRSKAIPPNSVLVFDIEVVDAKSSL